MGTLPKPPALPPLPELVDDIFYAVQREPDGERRSRLHELGILFLVLTPKELQLRDLLSQLVERGYARFVDTG